MSLMGSRLDLGGHTWRVASVLREGPAWRIVLRAVDCAEGTITARVEGTAPPGSLGALRDALGHPEARTFADEGGQRWKAELVPQWREGRMVGNLIVLSAEGRSARFKLPYTSLASLAVLTDRDLCQWLAAAQRAAVAVR